MKQCDWMVTMTTDEQLDAKIEELCKKARGMTFKPWETTPWDVREGPYIGSPGDVGEETWPQAQALRRKLIAEIEAAG
jgi:hypothetical protein